MENNSFAANRTAIPDLLQIISKANMEIKMSSSVAKEENKLPKIADTGLDFESCASAGMENITSKDIIIPRLVVLQSLSPQIKKGESSYIEGAEEGMICDAGTGDLFKSVLFLPVQFSKTWIEWHPRASGKGLAAIHRDESIMRHAKQNDKKQWMLPNGNMIKETHQFFGLNLSDGGKKVFIPFASTQIKKARKLNAMATAEKVQRVDGTEYTPAMWYRSYIFSSAPERNSEGSWSGWVIERGPKLAEIDGAKYYFAHAKEFYEQLIAGEVMGDVAEDDQVNEGAM